jgi:hypothetical protein
MTATVPPPTTLSYPAQGVSSTLRPFVSIIDVSGIRDRPPEPVIGRPFDRPVGCDPGDVGTMRRPEAPWDEAKALQRRSLSATGREVGRAIIEALLFSFEMIQHDPRCQPKQCYSGYNYLFEKVVVHGFSRISCSVCRESTPKQFSREFSQTI